MENNLFSRKWLMIIFQVIAWLLLFSLPFLLRPGPPHKAERNTEDYNILAVYFISNLLWVVFFYLNAMVLVPRLLYKRKFAGFTLVQLLVLVLYITIGWLLNLWLRGGENFSLRGHIFINFFIFLFMLATSSAFKTIIDRIRADKLADEKENENLKTELSLLRSQVSPHFMFNVLNNMVALARKKSDLLEPSLIKLSSLMRYMLYDIDGEKVSLEKEIEYLESFIDLQKQRISKSIPIHTDFSGIDGRYDIEPMLLIPFVENAFKHGTVLVENAGIDIVLSVADHRLEFRVRNRYNEEVEEVKDRTSGIGLTNVKRRLNLLYGRRHHLQVEKKQGWFTVLLTIELS